MLDAIFVAGALAFFAASIAYCSPATECEGTTMIFDYSLAAIVTAAALVYLVFALLRPEQF
jgi:K+-transporting ATPase KdpF subunit